MAIAQSAELFHDALAVILEEIVNLDDGYASFAAIDE
jgi:hypothetical protein